jgi:hypothetical protein
LAYEEDLFETAARELVKCKSDLLEVQEVRWGKVGNEPTDYFLLLLGWD